MASRDRTDLEVPLVRRSFVLNVINGAISVVASRVTDPGTVVPLLVLRLVGAEWVVGLVAGVQEVGRIAAQLFSARVLDAVERKRPVYVWGSVARVVALTVATGALLLGVGRDPRLVLAVLLAGLLTMMLFNGITELAWVDITARSVPSHRRGSLLTGRRLCGLILSVVVAAPLVDYCLAPAAPYPFPANYGVLFGLSTVMFGLAWTVFSLVREPASHAARRRLTWRQHFSRGVRIYRRDETYRGLLRLRFLAGLSGAVPTFFIAYAIRDLGLPERSAAVFLTIRVASEMLSSLIVGRMSDRSGNRAVIVASTWMALATFGAATGSALLAPAGTAAATAGSPCVLLLGVAFAGLGLLAAGRETGEFNYMLDIAPGPKRPSYVGFGNAFLLPLCLTPILVGWLAPRTGYLPLFALASLLSAVSILAALRLSEPREGLGEAAEGAD